MESADIRARINDHADRMSRQTVLERRRVEATQDRMLAAAESSSGEVLGFCDAHEHR